MSDIPVLILHGWSDTSASFKPLANFLRNNGRQVIDIWLADYVSMHDEVTIYDLGNAMGRAIREQKIPESKHSFDVIIHSTGALVVRQYLLQYFYGKPDQCPIQHLVMLAPANFGSPLASAGQSVTGRFFKGWKWDGMFQTGKKVLDALKLASPITFRMAERDLFNPENPLFKPEHIFTTILVGSEAYTNPMRAVLHENGSDGTVRVATANLNASMLKVIFSNAPDAEPEKITVAPQYDPIAFCVAEGHNHGSITKPESANFPELGGLILKSLDIATPSEYRSHVDMLRTLTENLYNQTHPGKKSEWYHQYQHIVTCAKDQFGAEIGDYMIEFFEEADKSDRIMVKLHSEVLEEVTLFEPGSGYRSFFFDLTDLKREILDNGHQVDMSISAAAVSERIKYVDPKKYITVAGPAPDQQALLKPHTPLLVDFQLPRIEGKKKVFTLTKA
ncbi:MAG: hypothetical protein AB1454_14110 [Candidatus Auribacterota bacterium]